MLLLLEGVHGTSKSREERICAEGFNPHMGVRGEGVYFWRDNCFAEELAISWHKKCFQEGRYNQDSDSSCSVIKVNIDVDEDNFYNIDDPEFKDNILELLKQKGRTSFKNMSKLYDIILFNLEQKISKKILVVLTSVNVPPSEVFPRYYFNSADCYVVRDSKCITIKSCTFIKREMTCATVN